MAIIPGRLYTLTGQSTLTGSFYSTLYALTDSDVYISGSNLGEASFVMPKGMRFDATLGEGAYSVQNYITKVQINNTYGSVLVVEGTTEN
jgi:hypothetical protein